MSDLGRLFRKRATDQVSPLENFTTEALAIAIGHDHRPMKEALHTIDWSCEPTTWVPAESPVTPLDAEAILWIGAETQRTLWREDNTVGGYLDLILDIDIGEPQRQAMWVEVKVDAIESGSQLWAYAEQARQRWPSPWVITLGGTRVSPHVPSLLWSSVASAIEQVPDAHYCWVSLLEFLREEGIVPRPAPVPPLEGAQQWVDVVMEVNRRLRDVWPAIAWRDGQLRNSLLRDTTHGVVTTGGPLQYGLRHSERGWEWAWGVTTRNYQNVPLHREEILRDAETGHLPHDWVRSTTALEILERRKRLDPLESNEDVVAWFDEGLRQLRDARILDRFLAALRNPDDNAH